MKILVVLVPLIAVGAGAIYVSRRIAKHQTPFPAITSRMNTQVHRINQG